MASEISGYSGEELKNKNINDLIHPDDISKLKEYITNGNSHYITIKPNELRIITKTGDTRQIQFSNHLMKLNGNTVILGTAKDITGIKEAENIIIEKERAL